MTCWICHPGPCLTPDDCGLPQTGHDRVNRILRALDDPAFPTPEQVAHAAHALAQARIDAQGRLPL